MEGKELLPLPAHFCDRVAFMVVTEGVFWTSDTYGRPRDITREYMFYAVCSVQCACSSAPVPTNPDARKT